VTWSPNSKLWISSPAWSNRCYASRSYRKTRYVAGSLQYCSGKNWISKILIGSLFIFVGNAIVQVNNFFLPFAVILNGVASGYLLRVMRSSMKGTTKHYPNGISGWT
jgi:hypothetical protein